MPAKPKFNRTNENIDWSHWTWNPVTGCKTGCEYCYARDNADRFNGSNFEPTFHPDRLSAPQNTSYPISAETDIGDKNVFVCSMADLFGDWIPDIWVQSVLDVIANNLKWNFLFLTKNPKRYLDFDFPRNAWLGSTVDTQVRVLDTEAIFCHRIVDNQFVSCEPLLEPVLFTDMPNIDWMIIGARSRTRKLSEFQPEWNWIESLLFQARKNKVKVYFKPNLTVRPKEYPGVT